MSHTDRQVRGRTQLSVLHRLKHHPHVFVPHRDVPHEQNLIGQLLSTHGGRHLGVKGYTVTLEAFMIHPV